MLLNQSEMISGRFNLKSSRSRARPTGRNDGMKLLRYGPKGREKPGLLDANRRIRDLSAHIPDIAGDALSTSGLATLKSLDPASLPLVAGTPRLGPCVGSVPKI